MCVISVNFLDLIVNPMSARKIPCINFSSYFYSPMGSQAIDISFSVHNYHIPAITQSQIPDAFRSPLSILPKAIQFDCSIVYMIILASRLNLFLRHKPDTYFNLYQFVQPFNKD